MNTYSVGFCFTHDLSRVALIRKNRPEWQKGKLNGVGGHTLNGESFRDCMQREWEEEAGIPVATDGWKLIAEIRGEDFVLAVYMYQLHIMEPQPFKRADEQVAWYMTHSIAARSDLIPNVHWLVPLCLDEKINFPIQVFHK